MKNILKELKRKDHPRVLGALDIFKYIGPGLLATLRRARNTVMHCCGS